jgi:hypothetical protein
MRYGVRAVLAVGFIASTAVGCGSGGHDGHDGARTATPGAARNSPATSASPSSPAHVARLTAAQRAKALLTLNDLPPGFTEKRETSYMALAGGGSAVCRSAFHRVFGTGSPQGDETERVFLDRSSGVEIDSAVQTERAGHGHDLMAGIAAVGDRCGHLRLSDSGDRVDASFARESAVPLLDETSALRIDMDTLGQSVVAHLVAFRIGDNVGSVLYLASDDAGADAVTGYARTAAQRLRAVAGG